MQAADEGILRGPFRGGALPNGIQTMRRCSHGPLHGDRYGSKLWRGKSRLTCGDLHAGLNIYDISRPCEGGMENLCYPATAYAYIEDSVLFSLTDLSSEISAYLSRPDVRAMLGVDAQVPDEYALCNSSVNDGFWKSGDKLRSSADYVSTLLERGVRVLVYAGTYGECGAPRARFTHLLRPASYRSLNLRLPHWQISRVTGLGMND